MNMPSHTADIIVISLVDAKGRRESVLRQLDAAPCRWEFLDAVRMNNVLDVTAYDNLSRLHHTGYPMSLGELGCFLSHRAAWEICVARDRLLVVMEDDLSLNAPLERIFSALDECMDGCDILRLHGVFDFKYRVVKQLAHYKLVRHFQDPAGSTAYCIRPAAAKKLLAASSSFSIPVDNFIAQDWVHDLSILSLMPYPVSTNGSPTTIPDRNKPSLNVMQKIQRELRRTPDNIRKRIYRTYKYFFPL